MTRMKRRLVLAATATTLGVGGMLLSGASAMAATPAGHSTAITTSASQTTAEAAAAPGYVCYTYADGSWTCYY